MPPPSLENSPQSDTPLQPQHAKPALPTEKFKAGTVIIAEGDPPGAVYIVADGLVKVTKKGRKLTEIGKDGIFGDMALIDNSPRSATVTAIEDTQCFVIGVEDYKHLLATAHPLLQAITKILTGRLRQMTSIYYSE